MNSVDDLNDYIVNLEATYLNKDLSNYPKLGTGDAKLKNCFNIASIINGKSVGLKDNKTTENYGDELSKYLTSINFTEEEIDKIKKEDLIESFLVVNSINSPSESYKWQQLIDKLDNTKENYIIEIFFMKNCFPKFPWQTVEYKNQLVGADMINNYISKGYKSLSADHLIRVMMKMFKEVGLERSTNPFIDFIKFFESSKTNTNGSGKDKNKFDGRSMIKLNNAYAKGIIDYHDINGTSLDKTNHLLFNNNLYALNSDSYEFMLKSYEWLSNKYNVKHMNLKSVIEDEDIDRKYIDLIKNLLGLNLKQDSDEFALRLRNILIFGVNNVNKGTNNLNIIEPEVLNYILSVASNPQENKKPTEEEIVSDVSEYLEEMPNDEVEDIITKLISKLDYQHLNNIVDRLRRVAKEKRTSSWMKGKK